MELIREFGSGGAIEAGKVERITLEIRELVMIEEIRCDAVGFALRRVVLQNMIVFEDCDPVRAEFSAGLRWMPGSLLVIEVERTGLGPGNFRGGIYGLRPRVRARDAEDAG